MNTHPLDTGNTDIGYLVGRRLRGVNKENAVIGSRRGGQTCPGRNIGAIKVAPAHVPSGVVIRRSNFPICIKGTTTWRLHPCLTAVEMIIDIRIIGDPSQFNNEVTCSLIRAIPDRI